MSVRELSPELQLKAQLELNEVPSRVRKDIDYIKKWIHQEDNIEAKTDDQWILSFLRACKFSLEKTKTKLTYYYNMRTIEPAFFSYRNPFSFELQKILKAGFCLPLRKLSDPTAPRVLLLQVRDDQELFVIDMVKIILMVLEILINEDDNFVVAGHIVMQDFKNITFQHATEMTPSLIKNIMHCLQDAYPTRPKQFHYVNTPTFFPKLLNLAKHFMSNKIKNRIQIYSDANINDLYKVIPKSILPTEYGGEAGPVQNLIDYWKQKVEDYKEWFLLDQQNTCTSLGHLQRNSRESVYGVKGSFRKLDID